MQIAIDRFEGDFAIVELPDGKMARIERTVLAGFSEGDVIVIAKDAVATEQAKKQAEQALADLFL